MSKKNRRADLPTQDEEAAARAAVSTDLTSPTDDIPAEATIADLASTEPLDDGDLAEAIDAPEAQNPTTDQGPRPVRIADNPALPAAVKEAILAGAHALEMRGDIAAARDIRNGILDEANGLKVREALTAIGRTDFVERLFS